MARALLLVAAAASMASRALADEASSDWSGTLEGRGNLYQERSTRAVVPELELHASAPSGLRLSASYLVDVISSASVAQTGDESQEPFTELRHGLRAGIGGELELASAALDLSGTAGLSTEDDYTSASASAGAVLSLGQRATLLGLSIGYMHDQIRSNVDPDFARGLSGLTAGVSFERVLSARIVLRLNYQLAYLEGFLANAYRRVLVGPLPTAESHPRRRLRHNGSGALALALFGGDTALRLSYRAYLDSWQIAAITPELRVDQSIGHHWLVGLRYRFYAQTAAFFFRDAYPAGFRGPVTNDPKMGALQTHTAGLSLALRLSEGSENWLDLGLERYFSTSAYGDGVIATAGLVMGF